MTEMVFGDLSQVRLFDVLKPLLTDKKTGKVFIKGKEEGEICLEQGDIVHAKTSHFVGENAFFLMMGWRTGRVVFEAGAITDQRSIPIPSEQLILNWASRKEEFEKIKEAIPSPQVIFRLSLKMGGEEKHITADQWSVLALCNGTKTVFEIAQSLGWEEYRTLKTVYQLIQMGLIEKAEGRGPVSKKLVKEDFFPLLELELKRAVGPVAPFLIDDKLAEFDEKKESFPQDRALPFIEALSEEIPNPTKRNEFLKRIMKLVSF
ncbi:MAG: DUF4388 domain-containing protein [Desulfobacterota bacterium]|nr:DUF4388 domain-containing protein [Thermodesulfobacteriota bacterium]